MAIVHPCPACRQPLQLPQPLPPQVQCPKCGARINLKPAVASPPPPPPPAAQGHLPLIVLVSGVLLVGCLTAGAVGLAYWFSEDDKKTKSPSVAAPLVMKETKQAPQPAPVPITVTVPVPPKIQAAINKGVDHLRKRILESSVPDVYPNHFDTGSDTAIGTQALAGLALLEAKCPLKDAAVQTALGNVRREGPRLRHVYAQCAALFFLNRLHEAEPLGADDLALVRSLALRLVAGQRRDGRWNYIVAPIAAPVEQELLQKLSSKKYVPQSEGESGDNSMTQFALIALWGCRQHGIPVRSVLLPTAAYFHKTQNPEGAWGYFAGPNLEPFLLDSNTCAGLIALAIEKTLREDKKFQDQNANDPPAYSKADEQCNKAFAHLARVIGRTRNDPTSGRGNDNNIIKADALGDYYFLWCLERVAVIYDKKEIGGKDWYGWGAEVIVQNQRGDGSWEDRHGDVIDTCFALLFLTRANLAKDLTESIRSRSTK